MRIHSCAASSAAHSVCAQQCTRSTSRVFGGTLVGPKGVMAPSFLFIAFRMCMLGLRGAPRCPFGAAEVFKARSRTLFPIAATAAACPSSSSICASGTSCMSNGIGVADLGAVNESGSSVCGIVLLLL